MSEFVSVDSFLQELSSEGRLDSAGKFTLSLEHAKEKLSEFLLKSTQDYLLKLVQAGVAAGASTLDLRSTTASLSFSMYGVSFDPIDLENILTHLLQPGQGAQARALRHLAIAINTAITTRATGITLATWDGHKGHKIFWKAGGRSSQPWRPFRSQPCVHFGVRRTVLESASQFWHLLGQRDIFSMLTGGRAGLDPDRQTVLDRAIWCPVPLALNGQWLPRPRLGPPRGAIFSRTHAFHSSWLPLDNPEDPGIRRFHQQGMAWPWSRHFDTTSAGAVNAGLQDSFSEAASQLNWVLDGVLVASQPIPHISNNQYGWGVLSAHGCATDLTAMAPVQNEFLHSRAQRVCEVLEQVLTIRKPGAERPPLTPGQTQATAPVDRVAAWEAVRRRRKRFKSD